MKKATKKIFGLAMSLVMVLFVLAGCSGTPANTPASTSSGTADSGKVYDSTQPYPGKFVNGKLTEKFKLKILTPTAFTDESIIAAKKGFYEEVGIIPEFTGVLQPNVTMVQSLASGTTDLFNSGHVTTIAQAQQAGVNLKIVVTGSSDGNDLTDLRKTHMVWVTKKGSGIKSAKDLVGKTIAMGGKGSCQELWTSEYLTQAGLKPDQAKIVVMPDQQAAQAVVQGTVDVAVLHAPYSVKTVKEGGVDIVTTSYQIAAGAGDGRLSGVGARAFTQEFIDKYPDVVKAYTVATLKAQDYITNHYDDALKIAGEFLKMDTSVMGGLVYPDQQEVKEDQIDFWIKAAERNKIAGFETPGKVKASDLYTNAYNPFVSGELKWDDVKYKGQ
jgi:sulfonate transport system substrate-binding protein